MTKKISFIIVSSIILIFDITLLFVLNEYSVKPYGNDGVLYIVAKCIAVLLFAAVCIAGLTKKDLANYVIIYISTVALQFLPLAIRYLSLLEKGFVVSVVLFFVIIIIYSALVGGLILLSKKTLTAEKKSEGKTIAVKFFDSNDNDEKTD